MNQGSVLENAKYTCTICDITLADQANYQLHMNSHQNKNDDLMSQQNSVSTSSERHANSNLQNHLPSAEVFKKPYTPAPTRIDKGKNRQHEAASQYSEDTATTISKGSTSATQSLRSSVNITHAQKKRKTRTTQQPKSYDTRMSVFRTGVPFLDNSDTKAANQHVSSKSKAPRIVDQQTAYRFISEMTKEEMRELLHSSYQKVLNTPSSTGGKMNNKEHSKITKLIKKLDKSIRHTKVPDSMSVPTPHKGDIQQEIDDLILKIEHITRERFELDLENFYTKVDTQKMKFQLEHLRKLTKNEQEENQTLLGFTEKEGCLGRDTHSLSSLPPTMRKYADTDIGPTYTDDLMRYPSSTFL